MKKIVVAVLSLIMVLMMAVPAYAENKAASADEITALLDKVKLTGGTYHANGSDVPADLKIDENGRLVVTAGGGGGNLHLFADLGALKDQLQDYTVEVKMMGIDVADGWHYGLGINNQKDNAFKKYFTVRSGAYTDGKNNGTLMCYTGTAKFNTLKLGTPDTPFASMSAALNVENVISVTYKKATSTMVFKVNDVEIVSLNPTDADITLSDFCLIVPYTKTVAFSYMRVMDGEGKVVYNNDFTGNFGDSSDAPKHKVTVNYVYENGEKAAESVVQEVAENAYYNIESAPIAGYRVENATGKMGNEDVTVTITYKKIYKVTIHYVKADGTTVMEDYVIDNLVNGESYSAESLPLSNHTRDQETVSGTINGQDVEVTVTYSPVKLALTVKYQYADGTKAADDYTAEVEYGKSYSVESPVIEGYTADKTTVSSSKMTKKTEIVVTYTANPVATTEATAPTAQPEEKGCSAMVELGLMIPALLGMAALCLRKKEN